MGRNWVRLCSLGLLILALGLGGCGSSGSDGANGANGADGADGADGNDGEDGADGGTSINASLVSDEFLEKLEIVSEVVDVVVSSPPSVTFTLASSTGVPITGIVPFWEASSRYVRFTMAKLVPGTNGDPDTWVSYVRDATSGEPDYDTGSSIIDNGDGSYVFTFLTDVVNVPGVMWEPALTHRVAGQLGSRSVPIAPQNFVYDYVPAGGAVTLTHNVAVMTSCNECHDDLVFHGRRFKVEYCVTCHNPDLVEGEGNFSFMIHRIHAGGAFANLDGGIDYGELTYPQDLKNCRKCHNGDDAATPDADNWKNVPNRVACDGCHENFSNGTHTGPPDATNAVCSLCHSADSIEAYHLVPNATPNNPLLLTGQRAITYELIAAAVNGTTNAVTIDFRILSDGTALDMAKLPQDLLDGDRYPGLLLAWALPQDGISTPDDYNNLGRRAGQALSLGIDAFSPLETVTPLGTLSFDAGSGINTIVINDSGSQFPTAATLRAIGLQGYLRQDLDGDGAYDVSLHTTSMVVEVTGDGKRRTVVDSASCANCHEFFEGHGGNRSYNMQICTLCHVPNLSSSGRTVPDPTGRGLDEDLEAAIAAGTLSSSVDPDDPLTYPEDAQSFKDLVHGIHSSGFRTRPFQHVRGPTRQGYYDWSHVTFPRGASTRNCVLCHEDGTYELPLSANLLSTTVRTTGVADGQDATGAGAESAFVNVPNGTDWINTPMAGSCFGCHTSSDAMAHMMQNGALLSVPSWTLWSNRSDLGTTYESCTVCHGPGATADVELVHKK